MGLGREKKPPKRATLNADGPGVQIPVQHSRIRSHPGRDIEATAESADDRQEYREVKRTKMMAEVSRRLL